MTISRNLRFEILRRDGYRCHYCGATAADTRLTVDAVIPQALGGSHADPANLVTACEECNGGKAATLPDAPVVAEVSADAVQWAEAIQQAAAAMLARSGDAARRREVFRAAWDRWTRGDDELLPRAAGWEASVDARLATGLPLPILIESVDVAMSRRDIPDDEIWRYFCGIVWHKVGQLRESAYGILHPPGEL